VGENRMRMYFIKRIRSGEERERKENNNSDLETP
jgi:hypothetical protein